MSNESPPKRASSWGNIGACVYLIVLICLGIALLVPATVRISDADMDADFTKNRLSIIAMGAHSAHDAYKRLPPGNGGSYGGKTGTVLYHLLPFVEQQNIWNLGPEQASLQVVNCYLSPLDESAKDYLRAGHGGSNYAGNIQVFSNTSARMPKDFKPGLSNVVLFAVVAINCDDGGGHTHSNPAEPPLIGKNFPTFNRPTATGTPTSYTSRLFVAMADRSVRTLSASITPANWDLAMDPKAAPEALPANWTD